MIDRINVRYELLILIILIMFPLVNAVDVDICRPLNVTNTVYYLNNSVNTTGTCFTITANNVTLECQGNTVNYSSSGTLGNGISNLGYNFTKIKDCIIKEGHVSTSYKYPIYYYKTHDNEFINNTITTIGEQSHAMFIAYSDNNTIFNNTIKTLGDDTWSVFLNSSSNNTLINNSANSTLFTSYGVYGNSSRDFNHTIGSDNLAKGNPVNYTHNLRNVELDGFNYSDFGQVIFAWCENLTISNSNFSSESLNFFATNSSLVLSNNLSSSNGFGIYLYGNSNYNNLTNNNGYTSATQFYTVHLDMYSNYNTIFNNVLRTTGSNAKGIRIEGFSHYNNASNNDITCSGTTGYGIYLTNSNNNRFVNNTLDIAETAMRFVTSSNNFIQNNTIVTSTDSDRGISLESFSLNNYVSGNFITTKGVSGYGIYIASSNNNFINNSIFTSGTSSSGVYMAGSLAGLTTFSNMFIKTNGTDAYTIYLSSMVGTNFTINDSTLNSSLNQEIYVRNSVNKCHFNFTNVTKSELTPMEFNWSNGGNATVNMFWYLDINVSDLSTNLPINEANVTLTNVNNLIEFSELTNTSGMIARKTLLEYIRNGTSGNNITYYSNYTLNATKSGYDDYSNASLNLSSNLQIIPNLVQTTSPSSGPSSAKTIVQQDSIDDPTFHVDVTQIGDWFFDQPNTLKITTYLKTVDGLTYYVNPDKLFVNYTVDSGIRLTEVVQLIQTGDVGIQLQEFNVINDNVEKDKTNITLTIIAVKNNVTTNDTISIIVSKLSFYDNLNRTIIDKIGVNFGFFIIAALLVTTIIIVCLVLIFSKSEKKINKFINVN